MTLCFFIERNNQSLKGAFVVTLCQNETDVKCQMDIDSHISLTEQAGKIRLTELTHLWHLLSISLMSKFSQSDFPCLFCGWDMVEISLGNYTSASFWQRVAPTASFNTWDKRHTTERGWCFWRSFFWSGKGITLFVILKVIKTLFVILR